MKLRIRAPAIVALIAACATSPSIDIDYDRGFSFIGLETYAWLPEAGRAQAEGGPRNPLIEQRIVRAVDSELAARGYRQVEADEADFLVSFLGGTQERMDVYRTYDYYRPYGYRWGGWVAVPETNVRHYTEGTLLIDVIDRESQHLVWRGTATGTVRDLDPDEMTARINEAVADILAEFPPQG